MRAFIFVLFVLFSLNDILGQTTTNEIQVGTVLTLGDPSKGLDYSSVKFPNRNLIIKRGAIADFKSVVGERVEIIELKSMPNGNSQIVLKRVDGKKFFRFYPTVTANLEKALTNGELIIDSRTAP